MENPLRLIKKYPNRRLYDTKTSSYITLADVKQMVLKLEEFQVVDAKSVPEGALWVHDEKSVNAAKLLADLFAPDFPVPIGVFVNVEAPIYEDVVLDQEQRAISERGPGDIAKLLKSGDTWTI